MSLAHTILGLLQQQEMTGYDLKTTCFNGCIAHLWQADQAQIYRTLDKLEAQGWITCQIQIQHDRPNRKLYSTTPTGRAELIRWLQCPQPSPIVRDPLLVQLHFAALISNVALIELLQQEIKTHRERIAQCEAIDLPILTSTDREQQRQQLAIDLVMQREQVYIEKLQNILETLQNEVDSAP